MAKHPRPNKGKGRITVIRKPAVRKTPKKKK